MCPRVTSPRHLGAPGIHELCTLMGSRSFFSFILSVPSVSKVFLAFHRRSLFCLSYFSLYLSFSHSSSLSSTYMHHDVYISKSITHGNLMQMTLAAKERGYPPINRAPPCTLSVVALRYTSRREITSRQ